MNALLKRLCPMLVLCLCTTSAWADLLVDDQWTDGDRTETNLPEESAWYSSNAGTTPTLTAMTGELIGNVRIFETNAGSRLWITHFTPPGAPVELGLGETLKVSLTFVVSNVTVTPGTSRGLRVGLFNFSEPGAARVTADGFSTGSGSGAPGANVTGYGFNANFAQSFTTAGPFQIIKRTDLATNNLMGASAVYTTLGAGGGENGAPAFAAGVPYTLEFSVTRNGSTAEITTRFSDDRGWTAAHTVPDTINPSFKFDGFALRPNGATDTADLFTFTRFKAETIPFEVRVVGLEFPSLDGLRLTWTTLPGRTYRLESRASLDGEPNEWNPVTTVVADGSTMTFGDIDAFFEPQRFYRVVQLP